MICCASLIGESDGEKRITFRGIGADGEILITLNPGPFERGMVDIEAWDDAGVSGGNDEVV